MYRNRRSYTDLQMHIIACSEEFFEFFTSVFLEYIFYKSEIPPSKIDFTEDIISESCSNLYAPYKILI